MSPNQQTRAKASSSASAANKASGSAKLSKEQERQVLTDALMKELESANMGSGLLVVGGTKNDLGKGPTMITQALNPREINKSTITKMAKNKTSHGLLNRYLPNAISLLVDPAYIKGGLVGPKTGPHSNRIEWAPAAKAPDATILLLNGNHRSTFIAENYQKEFYIFHTSADDLKNAANDREKNDIKIRLTNATQVLNEQAVWLATIYDKNKIEASMHSQELLLELTSNTSLPSKDDGETEKLKNYIRLIKDTDDIKEKQRLKDSVLSMWITGKETASIRPAWVAGHGRLFSFIIDLYALEVLERSRHVNVTILYQNWGIHLAGLYIAHFRPMLAALHFLAMPIIMPTPDDASSKYLEKPVGLRTHITERKTVVTKLQQDMKLDLSLVQDQAILPILEGDLCSCFNDAFSTALSSYMHLYGTTEESELEMYNEAYTKYWDTVQDSADKIIQNIIVNSRPDDAWIPILKNMTIKMRWLEFGFDPTGQGLSLDLETRAPLLTEFVFPSITSNWNTKLLGKRAFDKQVDFSKVLLEIITWIEPCAEWLGMKERSTHNRSKTCYCLWDTLYVWLENRMGVKDPKKMEKYVTMIISTIANSRRTLLPPMKAAMDANLTTAITKELDDAGKCIDADFMGPFLKLLKAWHAEIKQASGLVLPAPSQGIYQACKRDMKNEAQEKALKAVTTILRHTGATLWRTSKPCTLTFVRHIVSIYAMKKHRYVLMKTEFIWSLREKLGEVLGDIAKDCGVDGPILWWDSINSQPQMEADNSLLALVPVINDIETFGSSSARALAAPTLQAHNTQTIQRIIELATTENLGSIRCDTGTFMDPKLKGVLTDLVETLATLSARQVERVRDPKLDQVQWWDAKERAETMKSQGWDTKLGHIKIASTSQTEAFWGPQSDQKLKNPKSFHSTSTVDLSKSENAQKLSNAMKYAKRLKELEKQKRAKLLYRSPEIIIDDDDDDSVIIEEESGSKTDEPVDPAPALGSLSHVLTDKSLLIMQQDLDDTIATSSSIKGKEKGKSTVPAGLHFKRTNDMGDREGTPKKRRLQEDDNRLSEQLQDLNTEDNNDDNNDIDMDEGNESGN